MRSAFSSGKNGAPRNNHGLWQEFFCPLTRDPLMSDNESVELTGGKWAGEVEALVGEQCPHGRVIDPESGVFPGIEMESKTLYTSKISILRKDSMNHW